MPNYIFAYHGGKMPETPEEGAKVMAAWNAWYGGMGDNLQNGGGPLGQSHTVSKSGVVEDGGANPISGFTVISAASYAEADKLAAGCPIIDDGGDVEVCEIVDM